MAKTPFCSQVLFPVSFRAVFCVIPSEAEGPRIFLDASRHTPNHGSTDVCDARVSFRWLWISEPGEESRILPLPLKREVKTMTGAGTRVARWRLFARREQRRQLGGGLRAFRVYALRTQARCACRGVVRARDRGSRFRPSRGHRERWRRPRESARNF